MAQPNEFDFYCEEVLPGKTGVKKVYESEAVLAFYHTKPSYEKHIVIIPKEHIHDLTQTTDAHKDLLVEILDVAKKLASDYDFEKEGVRLITNMGVFQDSPHLHFHLVSGDKL